MKLRMNVGRSCEYNLKKCINFTKQLIQRNIRYSQNFKSKKTTTSLLKHMHKQVIK